MAFRPLMASAFFLGVSTEQGGEMRSEVDQEDTFYVLDIVEEKESKYIGRKTIRLEQWDWRPRESFEEIYRWRWNIQRQPLSGTVAACNKTTTLNFATCQRIHFI